MYVLHLHWQQLEHKTEGAFFAWAETSLAGAPVKMVKQARKARVHPYCAAAGIVRSLLHEVTAFDGPGGPGEIQLLLPAGEHGPQPSPLLVHDWQIDNRAPPILAPWQIGGLWLDPVDHPRTAAFSSPER
jgi:hypothetical protein